MSFWTEVKMYCASTGRGVLVKGVYWKKIMGLGKEKLSCGEKKNI